MVKLDKIQGFLISMFLMEYALDRMQEIDSIGLNNFNRTIFLELKEQYEENGSINLAKLSCGVDACMKIITEFLTLSYKMDMCIDTVNENARNIVIDQISSDLKTGNMEINDAITKLSAMDKTSKDSLIDMSAVEYYKKQDMDTIETGLYEYDSHVGDLKLGDLTILFGRNGEGKTTVISQIIAHCFSQKKKVFLYSGEMSEYKLQDWLYRQVIGPNKDYYNQLVGKYGFYFEIKRNVVDAVKAWHKGLFFLYNRNVKRVRNEIDRLFSTMETAAKNGTVIFFIDNLMTALEQNANSIYSDQSNFVQKCKDFAVRNNVHVILMAHPNKEKKELTGEEGNLEKTDISGSNDIPNKADNIVAVERIWCADRKHDMLFKSLKDREDGGRKIIKMNYEPNSKRFYAENTRKTVNYDWKKFLKPEPKEVEYFNGEKQTFKNGEIGDEYAFEK